MDPFAGKLVSSRSDYQLRSVSHPNCSRLRLAFDAFGASLTVWSDWSLGLGIADLPYPPEATHARTRRPQYHGIQVVLGRTHGNERKTRRFYVSERRGLSRSVQRMYRRQ